MDKDQYLKRLLESIGHHQMAGRDGECRCGRCWQGWPCDAALVGRELAVSQARVARLEAAIRPCLAERDHGWTACRGCGMEWAPGWEFHQADCWVVPLLAVLHSTEEATP